MTRPISILFAATGLYPEKPGGRATYLYELTRALAERGSAVSVIAGTTAPDCGHPPHMDGLARQPGGGVRLARYPIRASNLLSEQRSHLRGLSVRLRELEEKGTAFDALVCEGPVSAVSLIRARCFRGARRIYSFHSPIGVEVGLGLQSAARAGGRTIKDLLRPFAYRCYRRWAVKAERAGLERADLVVCLSESMRGELLAAHPGVATRIAVVPGGVDTRRFHPWIDREGERDRLGVTAESRLLVTARRLESRMGLDNLIAALPQVLSKVKNVKLYIAGDGQEREALARQIAELGLREQARLLGHVPGEELPRLYAAADLFVLPTRSLEGFGLATLEALACGTAVVATPVGATPEWLAKLDRRMITEKATRGAIAEGILRMLEVSRTEGERLRRRCRSYAEQFCWSRIAQQFERELRSLLETSIPQKEARP